MSEKTHYVSHDVVVKKPIEKLHKYDRFKHLLKRLTRENIEIINKKEHIIDSKLNDHIIIEVYDEYAREVIVEKRSLKDIQSSEDCEWFLSLPVISHVTKKISNGKQCVLVNTGNSLKEGMTSINNIHYIRLKYLPFYYTNHTLYKTGLINHLIYDMLMLSHDPDPKTVIGTEAYAKIEKLCASQTPGDDIEKAIRKYNKKYGDYEKTNAGRRPVSRVEFVFSELCKFPVLINPSIMKKSEISWYIISKKRP